MGRLVLSGAGMNIGVLAGATQKMLDTTDIDFVAGSSAGGLIAACWAFNVDLMDAISRFPGCESRAIFLYGNKRLREFLYYLFGKQPMYNGKPWGCVVANISRQKQEIFSSARTPLINTVDACLATSAVPILLPSVQVGRSVYVDGGITSNFPIDEFGATHAIGFKRHTRLREIDGVWDEVKNVIGTVLAHNELEDRADCDIRLLDGVRDGLDLSNVDGLRQDFLKGYEAF